MLGNFYKVFKNDNNYMLPRAVLDIISRELPRGYGYTYNEKLNKYTVTPLYKDEPQKFRILFDNQEISGFPNWAQENPVSTMEYLYRTQKKLKISKAILIDEDGKEFPLSILCKEPFSTNDNITEEYIIPMPFPDGKKVLFETDSGKQRSVTIRRVPCESREYIKVCNTDFSPLTLCAFLPDNGRGESGSFKVSVTPSKADTVFDALFSLELLKGYVDGTLKINGRCTGKILPEDPNYDEKLMAEQLAFWNDVLNLEDKIGVRFSPRVKMNSDDYKVFAELARVFVDGKDVGYRSPVKYITVNKEAIDDPGFKNKAITEKTGLAVSFINGPEKFVLMGAEFELFSSYLLMDFKISHVETVGDEARIYLINAGDDPWKYYKCFSVSRDKAAAEQKRMQDSYLAPLQ